ncbi:hypothetical protein OPT61_g4206 [Boeremia exigua]|uniref:Uncharacterized protein n=1 Tax=Boeremia exigua TaxID=749465 RepID=A0ACC2IEU4_9PLEO|nr:hypothetical protein OPT61_g4206 [Boeremia exigua]
MQLARKVKCDRNDPCGNCVDTNIQCIRTAAVGRSASKRRRGVETAATPQYVHHFGLETNFTSPQPSLRSVPPSPSITEAQNFISREITCGKPIPADRLAVLNSAMSFVTHLGQTTRHEDSIASRRTHVANILDDISAPSVELLFWMLRELRGSSIGPHVLDYFKHVSPNSLKTMGLALINRTGDAETLLLYSICVNAAAYKFINTVLADGDIGSIEDSMRNEAERYLRSVQLAMTRVYLLSPPSLLFLQSLLCSAFISQGQGDSVHCWAFISAACRTCEDLNLESQVIACSAETEDSLELYHCYVWCHILDKNYSMMLGRAHCLLSHEGLDSVFSSPLNRSLSALLSTYLLFVPVQAIFILELHPSRITNQKALLSRVEHIVADLLDRLNRVHARINELHGPSNSWGGLHMGTELTTIQFSYHSLRTSILRSKQICLPAQPYVDYDCLKSARMAMSTLRSIQEAALTLTDVRSHVAYIHWTVLYHPLTPFFVLFCNVVATSDPNDFHTLKRVTEELEDLVELSTSIAKMQTLFKSFIELCEGLVSEKRRKTSAANIGPEPQASQAQLMSLTTPNSSNYVSDATVLASMSNSSAPTHMVSVTNAAPAFDFTLTPGSTPSYIEPGWGLFDVQPTLDWLDADFSIFDGREFHHEIGVPSSSPIYSALFDLRLSRIDHVLPTFLATMEVQIDIRDGAPMYSSGDIITGQIHISCVQATSITKLTTTLIGESSSSLTGGSGLLFSRREEEIHVFLREEYSIIPTLHSLESQESRSIKLGLGCHSFDFRLRIPSFQDYPSCLSCTSNEDKTNRFSGGKLTASLTQKLPPSISNLHKGNTVSYHVDVCVTTTRNMFKSRTVKSFPITVWPLDACSAEQTNKSSSLASAVTTARATIVGPSSLPLPPHHKAEGVLRLVPAEIMIRTTFQPHFQLVKPPDTDTQHSYDRRVEMDLSVTKLNDHSQELYLQSFQMLLVGYTTARAGAASHGHMSFWTLQSLSNIGLRVFTASDSPGMKRTIDSRLWDAVTIDDSVVPEFTTCNLERKYELEVLMGWQCQNGDHAGRVLFVQARNPVRISSGMQRSKHGETPRVLAKDDLMATTGSKTACFSQNGESRRIYEEVPGPPSYDEAIRTNAENGLKKI